MAFSFFKSIFLGDKVVTQNHSTIIAHEMIHIKQGHSYDLLFFEFMRILAWFNPMVYLYQNRISELHEFIADAQVAKTNRKEQYQWLLSQAFQTQNISFVNHFAGKSLLKKRIMMLGKTKSKKIGQLKYLVLVPFVVGMLVYTSSAQDVASVETGYLIQTPNDAVLINEVQAVINSEIAEWGSLDAYYFNAPSAKRLRDHDVILTKEEFFKRELLLELYMQEIKRKYAKKGKISKFKSTLQKPSTKRYESYVSRTKAFQILDENLQYSIKAYDQKVGLIDKMSTYPMDAYLFKVNNSKDLTRNELRAFNNKLDEIFEKGATAYTAIILTDDTYAFQVSNGISEDRAQNIAITSSQSKEITAEEEKVKISEIPSDVPFATVDQVPVFPGCEDAQDQRSCFVEKMNEHIRKNFNYPKIAQEKGVQGRVSTIFTIDTEGFISNVRLRGPDKLLQNETARIIAKLPQMLPGKDNGKIVGVIYSIPVYFNLKNGKEDAGVPKPNNLVKEKKEVTSIPFATIDEVPVFPGCEDAKDKRTCFQEKVNRHIAKNFRYPQEAQEKGIQGRVSTMFIIDVDGSISNIRMRGPDELLENEARRILEKLPKMTPGKQKDEIVQVPFSIPINFKLRDGGLGSDLIEENFKPLIIIDGEESSMYILNTMNRDKVETTKVWKDKAAVQKFGQKGKNGVIEVQTKKKED